MDTRATDALRPPLFFFFGAGGRAVRLAVAGTWQYCSTEHWLAVGRHLAGVKGGNELYGRLHLSSTRNIKMEINTMNYYSLRPPTRRKKFTSNCRKGRWLCWSEAKLKTKVSSARPKCKSTNTCHPPTLCAGNTVARHWACAGTWLQYLQTPVQTLSAQPRVHTSGDATEPPLAASMQALKQRRKRIRDPQVAVPPAPPSQRVEARTCAVLYRDDAPASSMPQKYSTWQHLNCFVFYFSQHSYNSLLNCQCAIVPVIPFSPASLFFFSSWAEQDRGCLCCWAV